MNAIVPMGDAEKRPAGEEMGGQCLTFLLRGGVYALPLAHVREIIEFGTLTSVPRMPAFVRGVMNLRGSVLPVVDLGARLGLGASEVSRKTCVVILEVSDGATTMMVGAMVDAVSEVVEIAAAEIQRAPEFGTGIAERFVRGMVRAEDRFTILLEASSVLSFKEMAKLAEQLEEA